MSTIPYLSGYLSSFLWGERFPFCSGDTFWMKKWTTPQQAARYLNQSQNIWTVYTKKAKSKQSFEELDPSD